MGTAVDDFPTEMLQKQVAAETAIHNGDVEPRLALWSRNDPLTVFGAKTSGTGWEDLNTMFRSVASWFSEVHRLRLRGRGGGRKWRPGVHRRL